MSNQEVQQNRRVEKFLNEYRELTEKHKVDFANYPILVPAEDGSFKIMIQSTPIDLEERERKLREKKEKFVE